MEIEQWIVQEEGIPRALSQNTEGKHLRVAGKGLSKNIQLNMQWSILEVRAWGRETGLAGSGRKGTGAGMVGRESRSSALDASLQAK